LKKKIKHHFFLSALKLINWFTRQSSEPAIFVAKVAKRPKHPLTFSGIRQQAHQNSQNISRMFVRLANENLPIPEYILIPEYSQTNAPFKISKV